MTISKTDVENIAQLAAEKAVRRVLTDLGIEHEQPYEMQADMNYLRELRRSCDQVKVISLRVAIGLVLTGAATTFWLGLRKYFTG